MGVAPLSLEDLTRRVEQAVGDGDDMELLAVAVSISQDVLSLGDALVGHFVDRARRAGRSWTAIGVGLGVSKQAARKRYAERSDGCSSAATETFLPRLRACLRQAGEEARLDGSGEVGTHHQLRGLLLEGVGAAVLEKLGVTGAALRRSSVRLFGEGGPSGDVVPPESHEARGAVAAAADLSRAGGHDYVGTEHLLFVLASDPGSRGRRLLNDLGVSLVDVKRELQEHVRPGPNRRRRRSKRPTCSFCGKAENWSVQLVAGPRVWICHDCVGVANGIFAERVPTA